MRTRVEITLHGKRLNGETYSDTVELTPEQYQHLLDLLQEEIDRRAAKPAHHWRYRNDEKYKTRHDWIIWLLTGLDI